MKIDVKKYNDEQLRQRNEQRKAATKKLIVRPTPTLPAVTEEASDG